MPDPRDPIRAQLIEARRAQILDAAAQVFAEKGFHRATTKEIAKAAGVSEGTIYNYFASKEDLLFDIMSRLAESASLDEMLDQSLSDDPRDFLTALLRYRYTFNQQNRAMIQTILSEIMTNPTLADGYRKHLFAPIQVLVEQHILARMDMGQIRPVDSSTLVLFFSVLFIGLAFMHIFGDLQDQEKWDALTSLLVRIVFDGLAIEQDV